MPKLLARSLASAALFVSVAGCGSGFTDAESNDVDSPMSPLPESFAGRPVEMQGSLRVRSPNVVIYVWDAGQVDGDVVSLAVDGTWVLQRYTLTASKRAIRATLNPKGASYLVLFANDDGSIPPNTAAVSIDDGSGEQRLVLSADLFTNGAVTLQVQR
ncbi:MAG TPA: hypothetical protein VN706_08575 [Gemmatimonadaceae bacterium]|nr:hypothetical protein [Gemmatimonadaceae bacterium]